MAVIAS